MKRIFKLNKLILFITILINTASFSQKKIRFINLESMQYNTIYEKAEERLDLPDFNSPITDRAYFEKLKDTVKWFNEKNNTLKKINELNKLIQNFEKIKLNAISKKEKKKLLNNSYEIYEQNKRKGYNDYSHSRIKRTEFKPSIFGYLYNADDIILKTKEVIEYLNKEIPRYEKGIADIIANANYNLSQDFINSLPKINKLIEILKENTNLKSVKGDYIYQGEIYISSDNDYFNKRYKDEIINSYVSGNVTSYEYYKNVNGDGKDVYINQFRYPKEYTIESEIYTTISEGAKKLGGTFKITAIDWIIKLKNGRRINVTNDVYRALEKKNYSYILNKSKIPRKVKLYLKQADPYLKKMYNGILARKNFTLTKSKRVGWVNATKQVKLIDKKIRALYDNDDDNYYDFQKLLSTKTIEDMIYYNKVLNNSKQMLGLH